MTFRAPRPAGWPDGPDFKGRDDAPVFYHHKRVEFDGGPGKDVRLKVSLEPTDLLEIAGTVLDDDGHPVGGAKVYLFTGDAKEETWLRTVHPDFTSSFKGDVSPDVVLSRTQTDKNGRWRFWTVRETGVGMPRGGPKTDWKSYCIGVEGPLKRHHKLVRGVTVPDDTLRCELTVRPDVAADEEKKARDGIDPFPAGAKEGR